MEEWLFTWGFGQKYPNKFIRIKGTFSEAREEMFKRFGEKWSMQYSSAEEGKLLSFGITELKED